MLALAVPLALTRRTLTATAETIAGFGLLLVLLDGYAAYSANLAGIRSMSLTLFSAILFGLVAGVAAAYRLASHLRRPSSRRCSRCSRSCRCSRPTGTSAGKVSPPSSPSWPRSTSRRSNCCAAT
jgi:hypothetical protein